MSKASNTRWRQRRREMAAHERYISSIYYRVLEETFDHLKYFIKAYSLCKDDTAVYINGNCSSAAYWLATMQPDIQDDTAKEKPYNSSEV